MTFIPLHPDVPPDELRAIVAGRAHRLSRREALRRIAGSSLEDREAVLKAVLENRSEHALARGVAAAGLAERATPSALEALMRAAPDAGAGVLSGAIPILARTGGVPEHRVLEDLAGRAPGPAADQARFAAALIAYRLRLDAPGLADRRPDMLAVEEPDSRSIDVHRPSAEDAERCQRSLAAERLLVGVSPENALQLRCGARSLIVSLDPAFLTADGVRSLTTKKALVAVVATLVEDGDRFSASHFVLSDPVRGSQVRFSICRPSGRLALTGQVTVGADVSFMLRAVRQPGAVAVAIDGRFGPDELVIDRAQAGARTHETMTPLRHAASGRFVSPR